MLAAISASLQRYILIRESLGRRVFCDVDNQWPQQQVHQSRLMPTQTTISLLEKLVFPETEPTPCLVLLEDISHTFLAIERPRNQL